MLYHHGKENKICYNFGGLRGLLSLIPKYCGNMRNSLILDIQFLGIKLVEILRIPPERYRVCISLTEKAKTSPVFNIVLTLLVTN
jgi:hypothetical protein